MSTKRQTQKEETRKKILEAATVLFLKDDFERITTDTIAQRAGVSKGAIFHHFTTKEQLGIEVTEGFLKQQIKILLPEEPPLPPRQRLRKLIEEGLLLAAETPGIAKLLIQVLGRVGEAEATRLFNEACIPYFRECTNLFLELNLPNPSLKAQLLIAIFDGLGVQFYMEGAGRDNQLLQDLADEIMDLFINQMQN